MSFIESFYQEEYVIALECDRGDGAAVLINAAPTVHGDRLHFSAACGFQHRWVHTELQDVSVDAACGTFDEALDAAVEWADRQVDPDDPALPDSAVYIAQLAGDDNPVIRHLAADALAESNDPGAIDALVTAARHDADDIVRVAALAALLQLNVSGAASSAAVADALNSALGDSNESVRKYAASKIPGLNERTHELGS